MKNDLQFIRKRNFLGTEANNWLWQQIETRVNLTKL